MNKGLPKIDVGVFGGSGFYDLLENAKEYKVYTPFGMPSSSVMVGEIGGQTVGFLPRHGAHHTIPPHLINYRANLWAMKELGAKRILGPSACGSLQADVKPGEFVIIDQFVDRTNCRKDTFFESQRVFHVSSADPYCPELRTLAIDSCKKLGIPVHERGTAVVIQGPRFSTRAESIWFASQGWEVINMTQYPEGYLARELDMCYTNIALITDYDAGVDESGAVQNVDVARVFAENLDKLKGLLYEMIPAIPQPRVKCNCAESTAHAEM